MGEPIRIWNLIAAVGLLLVVAGAAIAFFVTSPLGDLIFPVGMTVCWFVNRFGPAAADVAAWTARSDDVDDDFMGAY